MRLHNIDKNNCRHALRESIVGKTPICESVTAPYQSPEYFAFYNKIRKIANGRKLDPISQELLESDLGKRAILKNGERVYLDCPYVVEGIAPIKGLGRSILFLLGMGAAAIGIGELTSAKETPLGQAMYQAAQEGDQIAKKHYKQLDFISDEDPALLAKLSNKYLPNKKPLEETFRVYTINPNTNRIRNIMFTKDTSLIHENYTNKLTPEYWSARLSRYIRS